MIRQTDEILLGFARALRAAGVPVTQDRAHGFLAAAAMVGLDDQRATYTAGRATLCSSPDDLSRYDQVFEAYFNAREGLPRPRPATPAMPTLTDLPATDDEGGGAGGSDAEPVRAMASRTEVLRHRDVASLSAGGAAPARRDVRDPAPPATAAAYGAAPAVAPRRGRRLAHPPGQPAPDG